MCLFRRETATVLSVEKQMTTSFIGKEKNCPRASIILYIWGPFGYRLNLKPHSSLFVGMHTAAELSKDSLG